MSNFINITPQKSKIIHNVIYKNALKLYKDALVVANTNKSYSTANSLVILSSEEAIKAILVLLHSEGYNVYKIVDAKKFFSDHKIRHQLAQLIEITSGFFESVQKYENRDSIKLFKIKNEFLDSLINGFVEVVKAAKPIVESTKRINKLEDFNIKKNNGLYVGYKDKLIVPKLEITETDYLEAKDIVERIFKAYKTLGILYHPSIHNRNDQDEIESIKNQMKVFIDEGMEGFSFKELIFK